MQDRRLFVKRLTQNMLTCPIYNKQKLHADTIPSPKKWITDTEQTVTPRHTYSQFLESIRGKIWTYLAIPSIPTPCNLFWYIVRVLSIL